ncbi:MAG: hypothetical protein WCK49_02690 [Myxococcaceae bacterium]
MKLLSLIFIGILLVNCSSGSGSPAPKPPGKCSLGTGKDCPGPGPGPGPIPVVPNWSLYSTDPTNTVFWGTDITDPAFEAIWKINGLYDDTIKQPIGQENWQAGITYLKSDAFKNKLPNIGTYTCYDRKSTDSFGRLLNGNCTEGAPSTCTAPTGVKVQQSWGCTIYGKITCLNQGGTCNNVSKSGVKTPWPNNEVANQNANPCCVYQDTNNAIYLTGDCTIQDATQKKDGVMAISVPGIANACYVDGSGTSPATKHTNGFYCTSWETTTFDLSKTNLQLKNLYDTGVVGCMAPSTVVGASTQWGGLGIGSTCTIEDPSVITAIQNPTYLDASIMYANPYQNPEIAGLSAVTGTAGDQYSILNSFIDFCNNSSYSGFCKKGSTATSGLGHLVGQMGPVSLTNYVTFMKKNNPKGYYTWQYDDASSLTQCDAPLSNAIAVFCPSATPVTPPAGMGPANRFAAYNNCGYDIWVQAKTVKAAGGVPAYCTPATTVPNQKVGVGDCLVKLAANTSTTGTSNGGYHVYSTPQSGLQSFNIWSKTGCDGTGFNCKTGETDDNGGSKFSPDYGPQPDIETKVEGTFGCTLTDTTKCGQTQNFSTLSPSTFLDVTFVDGFTRPVQLQIIRDSKETNASCNTTPFPVLDINQCPTAEDLSVRP